MIERLIETEVDLHLLIDSLHERRRPFRVKISDGRLRSLDQNKLQWHWANEAGEQRGMSAQDVQSEWKLTFGVPILMGENQRFAKAWAQTVGLTWQEKVRLMPAIEVTSIMTMKQLARYLDEVYRFNVENGIGLTVPDELKWGPPNEGQANSSAVERTTGRVAASAAGKTAYRRTSGGKVR